MALTLIGLDLEIFEDKRHGRGPCTDVDECVLLTHTCHTKGTGYLGITVGCNEWVNFQNPPF